MNTIINKVPDIKGLHDFVLLIRSAKDLDDKILTKDELKFVNNKLKDKEKQVEINRLGNQIYIVLVDKKKEHFKELENVRKSAFSVHQSIKKNKLSKITIVNTIVNPELSLAFAEGLALSNYQFLKYYKDKEEKKNKLETINVLDEKVSKEDVDSLKVIVDAVCYSRDLVNEPVSYLTAEQLSEEIVSLGKESGFSVEVFGRNKIESLKMGGLLAVNKGSYDPPTFSILEWKPKNATNSKPYVLVGKGIVFDTGGLSLKPTRGSMDLMKSDMGGAASVIGAMYAIAKNKLPIHVIILVPATDNRPGNRAYAPQDVITMHDGTTVEVLNTDAEGRMILADALSYAKKYDPELVIDLATLTGAAHAAIGHYGIVGMGNAKDKIMKSLQVSGENVYERVVEFPFWEEYEEMLKSDIADLKNIGGSVGGAITAGKFLEHFTDYPYIHLDIAGPAFLEAPDNYRGKAGSGVGVRLLFDFVKNLK